MSPRRALALLALVGTTPPGGTLVVAVGNVRNASGRVHVDVCPQAFFLKDNCPLSAEAPAHAGVTEVLVHDVPPGLYAVQATHDENGNGKVDRALFGIPREGVGFSRDAPIRLSPPKWQDAVIEVGAQGGRTALRLRYFLGAKGPDPR